MVDRVTWVQIGVILIVALISCNSQGSEMEIEKARFPLLQERPAKQEGAFVGVIQIRRVTTSSGCTVPPAENTWAVFEYQGCTLPIKKVSAAEAKAIAANEALGFTSGGPLWTPQELCVAEIKPGSVVLVEGVIAPLIFSGSIGPQPVYGLCAVRINPSPDLEEIK